MVPEEFAAELGAFFREKSAPAVSAFAGDLVDALFQGIPESANSKEVPAKTKVRRIAVQVQIHGGMLCIQDRDLAEHRYLHSAACRSWPDVQCLTRYLPELAALACLSWPVTGGTRGDDRARAAVGAGVAAAAGAIPACARPQPDGLRPPAAAALGAAAGHQARGSVDRLPGC